jgi:hypothetical protein
MCNSLPPYMPHAQPISPFWHPLSIVLHTVCSNTRDDLFKTHPSTVNTRNWPAHKTLPVETSPGWFADIPRDAVSALNRRAGRVPGDGRWAWPTFQILTAVLRKIRLLGCVAEWVATDVSNDNIAVTFRATQREGHIACGVGIVEACVGWQRWMASQ